MGVRRLLGPAHGPVGFAQRLEHDRVVGLELERTLSFSSMNLAVASLTVPMSRCSRSARVAPH
jgi:hypothetical protein